MKDLKEKKYADINNLQSRLRANNENSFSQKRMCFSTQDGVQSTVFTPLALHVIGEPQPAG